MASRRRAVNWGRQRAANVPGAEQELSSDRRNWALCRERRTRLQLELSPDNGIGLSPTFLEGVGANHRMRSGCVTPSRKVGGAPKLKCTPENVAYFVFGADNVPGTAQELSPDRRNSALCRGRGAPWCLTGTPEIDYSMDTPLPKSALLRLPARGAASFYENAVIWPDAHAQVSGRSINKQCVIQTIRRKVTHRPRR